MLAKWLLSCCLLQIATFDGASGLVSRTATITHPHNVATVRNTQLHAVSNRRIAVLDGSEWASVETLLPSAPSLTRKQRSKAGYMTVVTGTDEFNTRVVGIQASSDPGGEEETMSLGDGVEIYKDSMATIPNNVGDQDAISTLVASLSGVYCGLPRLEHVGGGTEESFVSGKVVVMGGSDYARFVADALAALGASVYLVSTRKVQPKNRAVEVMTPSVGELQLGFASVLGEFDSLVDTMSDEQSRLSFSEDDDLDMYGRGGSGVVRLLKSRHKCDRYISTMTESQRIVRDSGVLFGPKQADQHVSELTKAVSSSNNPILTAPNYRYVVPPKGFANVIQTLLDKGVLFTGKQKAVRGWSLQDFWELASWPRDSEAGANVRFGLPVVDDIESLQDDKEEMVSAPPMSNIDLGREEPVEDMETNTQGKNPFVMDITTVSGLQKEILSSNRDCVLFMSAPYCRTCRYLTPAYTRMARLITSDNDKNVFFAKANTAGKSGKELGRALEVESVPSFVMFRGGQRYGTPLAITKLPSKKLDLAVEFLTSGMEWDSTAFRDMD